MNLDGHTLVAVREVLHYLESDRYMGKADAARYLGVGMRTLEGWMDQLPKYRPGAKALFKKSDLDAFMKRHLETPVDVDLEKIANDAVASILK